MKSQRPTSPRHDLGERARRQRGSALVIAVFTLTMLTGMGVALLFLGQTEVKMSQGDLRAKQAFFLAEAGLEDARMALHAVDDGDFNDDLLAVVGPNGGIDFDVTRIERGSFDSQGNLVGVHFTSASDDTPVRPLTAFSAGGVEGWHVAYLTNDPAEVGGIGSLTDTNDRVMVTAIGVGGERSSEIVQAIIEPFQLLAPPPPAALSLLGALPPHFSNGNSNAQSHTGNDCGVGGGDYVPVVGTIGDAAQEEVQDDMRRPQHFDSGPFTGEDTVGNLLDPSQAILGGKTTDPVWTDCLALKEMVEQMIDWADFYCNSDQGQCTIPAGGPHHVTVIDGDVSTHTDSAGTLLVTGELVYNGQTQWDGVVLVVGEGRMIRQGGGNGQPSGGVVVANIDPSPGGPPDDKSDWCTEGDQGFLAAYYDTHGNGNSSVEYCSTKIEAANPVRTFRIVDFLQR